MFPDKARHWIKGPYYSMHFDSWKQWVSIRPYTNASWLHKPLLWNIRSLSSADYGLHELQILYMLPDGLVDIKAVHVIVKPEDEDYIVGWLMEHGLVSLLEPME